MSLPAFFHSPGRCTTRREESKRQLATGAQFNKESFRKLREPRPFRILHKSKQIVAWTAGSRGSPAIAPIFQHLAIDYMQRMQHDDNNPYKKSILKE
jgi:hypothetical protein